MLQLMYYLITKNNIKFLEVYKSFQSLNFQMLLFHYAPCRSRAEMEFLFAAYEVGSVIKLGAIRTMQKNRVPMQLSKMPLMTWDLQISRKTLLRVFLKKNLIITSV